jgi:plasmid maintenance system antidote protein VapI
MTTAKCTIKNSTLLKIMQNMNPETWNNMQSDVDDHMFTKRDRSREEEME